MAGRLRRPHQRRRPKQERRRPDLSQHFLKPDSATRLIGLTEISQDETVIEIGAGRGALTGLLAARASRVVAVEIDPYLADVLRKRHFDRVEVFEGDFLRVQLPQQRYQVIGNIPYAHSAAIIDKLIASPEPPSDAWLVVQREFAQRLCGSPFGRESVRSLELKPAWHLEIIDHLRRTEFIPPPAVESVYLHLQNRVRPLIDADATDDWRRLVAGTFDNASLRRGLARTLSKRQITKLAADYRFHIEDPPGALSFEQWLGIFRFVQRLNGPRRARRSSPPP